MSQNETAQEKILCALSIVQRILNDSWLIEERALLIEKFAIYFQEPIPAIEEICSRFFHPHNFSVFSRQVEQAQQKRLSIHQRIIPNDVYFKESMQRFGSSFALRLVHILIAILQTKQKEWKQILYCFEQLVALGVEPLLVMALYQKTGLIENLRPKPRSRFQWSTGGIHSYRCA